MTNTKMSLTYRDASNYKARGEVVFAGPPAEELVARAKATFGGNDDDSIICSQVDVDGPTFGGSYSDDGPWTEVDSIEPTDEKPNDDRTFEQFVDALEAVECWDEGEDEPLPIPPFFDNGNVTYTPMTERVGYKATHRDGRVEYIHFNPSSVEQDDEQPTVFVYLGTEGDPSQDPAYVHFNMFDADVRATPNDDTAPDNKAGIAHRMVTDGPASLLVPFFETEMRNHASEGYPPPTLSTALDSLGQAPHDVINDWCDDDPVAALLGLAALIGLVGADTELGDIV